MILCYKCSIEEFYVKVALPKLGPFWVDGIFVFLIVLLVYLTNFILIR